jgi:hypothetical protein
VQVLFELSLLTFALGDANMQGCHQRQYNQQKRVDTHLLISRIYDDFVLRRKMFTQKRARMRLCGTVLDEINNNYLFLRIFIFIKDNCH